VTDLLDWLRAAPPNAVPIATAVLAAVVALVVATLTQWILGRRARTDLLTKRLEELYVLILQWMDEVTSTKILVDELVDSQPLAPEQRLKVLERYSKPRVDRRISMYIDLYFRRLDRFNKGLFEANRGFARVIRLMGQGNKTSLADIQRGYVKLHNLLSPLRQEIVENRARLTGRLQLRYKDCKPDDGDA
jgi:hypothetical protein